MKLKSNTYMQGEYTSTENHPAIHSYTKRIAQLYKTREGGYTIPRNPMYTHVYTKRIYSIYNHEMATKKEEEEVKPMEKIGEIKYEVKQELETQGQPEYYIHSEYIQNKIREIEEHYHVEEYTPHGIQYKQLNLQEDNPFHSGFNLKKALTEPFGEEDLIHKIHEVIDEALLERQILTLRKQYTKHCTIIKEIDDLVYKLNILLKSLNEVGTYGADQIIITRK